MGGFFVKSMTAAGLVVAGIFAIKIIMGILGAVFGLASFILFTVLPLAFVGWIIVSIIRHWRKKPALD